MEKSELLPPYSREAEESMVGAVLLDPELLDQVVLDPKAFFLDRLRWPYEVMKELRERRLPVEFVSVCDELQNRGQLEEIGGPAELLRLLSGIPTSTYALRWSQIIKERARQRRWIEAAGELARAAYESLEGLEERALEILPQRQPQEARSGIRTLISQMIDDVFEGGEPAGLSLGFPYLEELIGRLDRTRVFILSGEPGTGKTALSLNVAFHALRQGARVLFETLEMSPQRCLNRMVAAYAGVPLSDILRRRLDSQSAECVVSFLGAFAEAEMFFRSDDSLAQVKKSAAIIKPDLLVVDYLQLLSGTKRDRVQEMEEISREMKLLARERPVWAVSSLSRAGQLRWSGQLNYDADVIMLLVDKGQLVKLEVQKQKEGPTGLVIFRFVKELQRFVELRRTEEAEPAPMAMEESLLL